MGTDSVRAANAEAALLASLPEPQSVSALSGNDQPRGLAGQLVAICLEHGLNSISVDVHVSPDGSHFFGSYAHAEGICGSASVTRTTPSDAMGEAVANVLAKLGRPLLSVPEMEAA